MFSIDTVLLLGHEQSYALIIVLLQDMSPVVKEFGVVSQREKLARSQWTPSHMLPKSGFMKGSGLSL